METDFWSRWKEQFLNNLQPRQRRNRIKRTVCIDGIVLLKTNDTMRNHWSMVPDNDCLVRAVTLILGTR